MLGLRSILVIGSLLAALVSAPGYADAGCDEPCCDRPARAASDGCCEGALTSDERAAPCACDAGPADAPAHSGPRGRGASMALPPSGVAVAAAHSVERVSPPRPASVRAAPSERRFLRNCALLL